MTPGLQLPAPRDFAPCHFTPPCAARPTFVGARHAVPVFCAAPRAFVGAQFIAPFSPRLPLNLRFSPGTSHQSRVTNPPSRVTAS
jgi:hypothetical protein